MVQDPAKPAGAPVSVGVLYQAAHYGVEHRAAGEARQMADVFVKELVDLLVVPVSEPFAYDVALVVTELLTNANRYAPGPCLLELEGRRSGVRLPLWDSSTALPRLFPRDPTRIGGHGMEIINRICAEVRVERVPVGKRIRATLCLPAGL